MPPPDARREAVPYLCFAAGEVVAGRYEIVRFLAKGGMGEVYEAQDRLLRERVALKTILEGVGTDPMAVERFKREIQLARRVTHPSICRLHDIGIHAVEAGPSATDAGRQILFLTMEMLSGESLSQLIRKRRLRAPEALPIVRQMAAGLQAAHDAGIVHRDFKSANVLVCAPPSPGQPPRVVITDFGLARHTAGGGEGLSTISEAGAVVGTPAYMAPEQVEGKKVGPAADLYALGVVLFEMVTGSRPFEGGSPFTGAVRRLVEPPPRPSTLAPDLDPAWEAVILRCLARDPADRFGSAADVIAALERSEDASATTELPRATPRLSRPVEPAIGGPRSRRRGPIATALLLAIVVAAFAAYVARRSRTPAPKAESVGQQAPPATARRSVAVLGLRNASGKADLAWLSTALSELLATELAAGEELRVVPGQEAWRAVREQGEPEADGLGREVIARVGRNAGADLLVLGSFSLYGEAGSKLVRVDVRAQEAATGNLLASAGATGTDRQLFDVASRVGSDLRRKLGLKEVSPAQALEVEASLPAHPVAARLYSEGLARLRLFDAVGAKDILLKAVAAAPRHPLPHLALAGAWQALGYEPKAREEAAQAAALAGSLSERDRLSLEARVHEVGKQWDKAVATLETLVRRYPDDLDAGLRLAEAQVSAGKANAALVTSGILRKLPGPAAADPRIDLVEARTYRAQGDFEKAKSHADAAARKARDTGASLILARARGLEAVALLGTGDTDGASAAAEEARKLFRSRGDRASDARIIEVLAGSLYRGGDLEGSRRLYEKALTVFREIGDRGSEARVLTNIATLLYEQGNPRESAAARERALGMFRETGAKYELAFALNVDGAQLFQIGDVDGAERRYQQALGAFGELGERRESATVLTNLGEVFIARGKLVQARSVIEEALATSRELGDKGSAAYATRLLGELLALRCDLMVAREKLGEAARLQEEAGEKGSAAETRVVLARLELGDGTAAEAEKLARESEERLRTEGSADRAIEAGALQAQALTALGRLPEATEVLGRVRKASVTSADRRARTELLVAEARVAAMAGSTVAANYAEKSVAKAAEELRRLGFVPLSIETRLAAAELQLALGRRDEATRQLEVLAKEAGALELGCLARRATSSAARAAGAATRPTTGG